MSFGISCSMCDKYSFGKYKKIYFIGIGGIGMSALAKHCLNEKITVLGSDKSRNGMVKQLKDMGIPVTTKRETEKIKGFDAIVYTSAVKLTEEEISTAEKYKIPLIKRSELLGEIVKGYSDSIAVCGCHGKTTTTAMMSKILIEAKVEPTVFLGGNDKEFGNYRHGKGKTVVYEACEYKKNFLDTRAKTVVVTNIDNDHLDSYKDLNEQIDCVNQFIKGSVAVINADDKNSKNLFCPSMITYGIENRATYQAKRIREDENGVAFTVYGYGIRLGRIRLNLKGKYNVQNALSVIAVAIERRISFKVISNALKGFSGVGGRNERVGEYLGRPLYLDYAHHPSELNAILKAIEDLEQTLIIFQPHTYSRTRILLDDFVKALSGNFPLILYKTFPARERYDQKGSAKTLYNILGKVKNRVYYADKLSQIDQIIKASEKVNKIYVIGAGDLGAIMRNKKL